MVGPADKTALYPYVAASADINVARSPVNRLTDYGNLEDAPLSQVREPRNDLAAAVELAESYHRNALRDRQVVMTKADGVEQFLIGPFARGHVFLVGVPGFAKTLLVSTVAQILSLSFRRVQFSPDMMPSDITGTDILQENPESGIASSLPSRGLSSRTTSWLI